MARTAYDYALELLSARAYTVRSLHRKLAQKSFEPDEIAAAEARLERAGLLDDERYASEYARQKLALGGRSARRVQQELVKRGVAGSTAHAALERVLEEEPVDIGKSLDSAARKKLAAMGDLDPAVKRRRLFAFLARRGFELSDIKRTVSTLLADNGSDSV